MVLLINAMDVGFLDEETKAALDALLSIFEPASNAFRLIQAHGLERVRERI